jgi:hypothetical protein
MAKILSFQELLADFLENMTGGHHSLTGKGFPVIFSQDPETTFHRLP